MTKFFFFHNLQFFKDSHLFEIHTFIKIHMFSKSTFFYKIRKIQILKKITFLTKFTIYLSSSHFPNSHLRKSKLAFPIFFISDVFLAMRHFTRSLRPKVVEKSVIFPVHHGLKMKMVKKTPVLERLGNYIDISKQLN